MADAVSIPDLVAERTTPSIYTVRRTRFESKHQETPDGLGAVTACLTW